MDNPPRRSVEADVRPTDAVQRDKGPPARHRDFDHLAMEELRAYRDTLADAETQVSYQRRVLQATLAEVRGGRAGPATGWLAGRISELAAGRAEIMSLVPADGLPQLPDPAHRPTPGPAPAQRGAPETVASLGEIERRLAAYQASLEERIAAATTELIARYRERPTLALRALPLTPVVHPREPRY